MNLSQDSEKTTSRFNIIFGICCVAGLALFCNQIFERNTATIDKADGFPSESSPRIPFEATFENSIEFCYRGKVVNVIDGDTIDVQLNRGFDDFTVKRFRLSGINAPEMKDVPKGEEAKNTLSSMILNKPVIVKTKKDQTDRYGRFLGTIYLDEGQINVNEQMVKIGKATIY